MRKRFILSVILMMGVCGQMHASATAKKRVPSLKDLTIEAAAKALAEKKASMSKDYPAKLALPVFEEQIKKYSSKDARVLKLISLLRIKNVDSARDFKKVFGIDDYSSDEIQAAIEKLKKSDGSKKLITLLQKVKIELDAVAFLKKYKYSPSAEEFLKKYKDVGVDELLKKYKDGGANAILRWYVEDFILREWSTLPESKSRPQRKSKFDDRIFESPEYRDYLESFDNWKKDITEYYPQIAKKIIIFLLKNSTEGMGNRVDLGIARLQDMLVASEILRDSKKKSVTDYLIEFDGKDKFKDSIRGGVIKFGWGTPPKVKELIMPVYIRVLRENGDADWAEELESLLGID